MYSRNRCRRCAWWNGSLLSMRTSCSRMAFWSNALQVLGVIAVTFQLQERCIRRPVLPRRGTARTVTYYNYAAPCHPHGTQKKKEMSPKEEKMAHIPYIVFREQGQWAIKS